MDALVTKMNALCEALPFQTSWYLKDFKTGKTANRLGDEPVPSASTRKISILAPWWEVTVHADWPKRPAMDDKAPEIVLPDL